MVFKNVCNCHRRCLDCRKKPREFRRCSACVERVAAFVGGCALGQLYYIYLLKKIPFPERLSVALSLGISLLLGLGNLVCSQLRCISLLTFPMYCGKPGRGVLKAVVLTYVIAGPITNMGLNAKEVVRVFACTTQLSYNLSRMKYGAMSSPFRSALFNMRADVSQIKDTIRSIRDVAVPVQLEIEEENVAYRKRKVPGKRNWTQNQECRHRACLGEEGMDRYQYIYTGKLTQRCEGLLSRTTATCISVFTTAWSECLLMGQKVSSRVLCWPEQLSTVCDLKHAIGPDFCDSSQQINPGLGEGYGEFKKAKQMLMDCREVSLQYQINTVRQLYDVQDAKETGDRVMHAFDEKYIIMHAVTVIVDVCVALFFLRILTAAATYHDQYLQSIEHDNIYITSYFKRIDERRRKRNKHTLLPLKKMERSKYVDVHSINYKSTERDKLVTHILKVMLEVVTATTFVMLDRLFYETLDVVRQHAETELPAEGTGDLEIQVEGTGTLAGMVRKILNSLNSPPRTARRVTNESCLPRPRLMPAVFYFKIYGGYLWILLLLYINPYTMRLKRSGYASYIWWIRRRTKWQRFICSYYYPRREKQRILHLYNDILKKRIKMQKTFRRKAVQTVRAHYLSSENLLSLRMKFPRLLGWLQVLPAARMTCLICGETAPRGSDSQRERCEDSWHTCATTKCPFGYCVECWREVGARCLACDPSLADLSDMDSLTEDELRG